MMKKRGRQAKYHPEDSMQPVTAVRPAKFTPVGVTTTNSLNGAFEQQHCPKSSSSTALYLREFSRFLQGKETDQKEVDKIRNAVKTGTNYCGRLYNYKKDGTPFWNVLTVTLMKDENGKAIKFIGCKLKSANTPKV